MKRILTSAALGLTFFASASAFAADGYITGDVNLRAGPDSTYPSVSTLSTGTSVAIEGCVDGWSWCDVASGDNRGWVAGNFLQEEYQGQRVLVPEYGVQIGIPIVSFVFGTYWDDHYRNRPWYGDRERWSRVTPQYRPVTVRENTNGNSHGVPANDAHISHTPGQTVSEESKRSKVSTTTPPSYQGRPATAVVPQHPVATQARTPAKSVEGSAAASRTVATKPEAEQKAAPPKATQPKVIAEHKAVEPKAPQKETAAKPSPEHEPGKDKDQH